MPPNVSVCQQLDDMIRFVLSNFTEVFTHIDQVIIQKNPKQNKKTVKQCN